MDQRIHLHRLIRRMGLINASWPKDERGNVTLIDIKTGICEPGEPSQHGLLPRHVLDGFDAYFDDFLVRVDLRRFGKVNLFHAILKQGIL